jgi:chaperonin cofactor prefoldin
MERDKHYQRSLELNTKCSLYESKISQLEKHQEHLEDQLKSADKKTQAESDKNYDMRAKM